MTSLHPGRPAAAPTRPAVGVSRTAGTVVGGTVVAGVAAVLLARLLIGADYRPAPFGLPDAGPVTARALPLLRFGQEITGVAVVGALVVRLLLGAGAVAAVTARLGAAAVAWAGAWAACSAGVWLFSLSDLAGVPLADLPGRLDAVPLMLGTDRMLSVSVTLWLAVLLALFGRRFDGRGATAGLLAVAVAGLLPEALTGHVAHHNADIALATVALAVHVAAAALWVGGLLTIVVHLRREPVALAVVTPRVSALALDCVAAVGLSGVVASVAMLDGWAELWSTERGALTLAKTAALALLLAVGLWHRRRTVAAAASGRVGPLLRLGAVELALMGATLGLAVVLSGTA